MELTPTIMALRERFTKTVEDELRRIARSSGTVNEDEISSLARSVVNKLLHDPLTELKASAADVDQTLLIASVRRLFALDSAQTEDAADDARMVSLPQLTPAKAGGGSDSK